MSGVREAYDGRVRLEVFSKRLSFSKIWERVYPSSFSPPSPFFFSVLLFEAVNSLADLPGARTNSMKRLPRAGLFLWSLLGIQRSLSARPTNLVDRDPLSPQVFTNITTAFLVFPTRPCRVRFLARRGPWCSSVFFENCLSSCA